jgi:hypothetical protein
MSLQMKPEEKARQDIDDYLRLQVGMFKITRNSSKEKKTLLRPKCKSLGSCPRA